MADYNNIRKILQGAVERKQKAQMDTRSKELMGTIGQDLVTSLTPVLSQLASQSAGNRQDMITEFKSALNEALKEIKVDNRVEVPPIDTTELAEAVADAIRGIKITPQINVSSPEVRMPEIPAPIVNIPDLMKVMGEVSMPGYDYKNPLPVLMMDSGGKPFQFSMGASGGKSDFFTIKGFGESAFSVPVNSEGQVPISGTIVTSAPDTTYVIPGNREGVVYNSDNPMPVTITSGASATTATNIVDSSGVAYSGSNPVPVVITSGASATTAVQNLNADGTYRDTFPVSGTVLVSDITASVKTALVDSSGVQYSGSNPVPISDAGGSITVDGTFWQATQPVSGTVTANLGTIADVATQTTLSAINAKLVTGTDIGDVTINNASGASAVNIQDGGNSITVDGTVGVSGTVTANLAAGTNNIGDVDVLTMPGTGTEDAPETAGGILMMAGSVRRDTAASSAGTTGDNATINTDATGRLWTRPQGDVDNGTADTGFPIKIGGVARTANPTAVAGGNRVNASFDDLGRQICRPVQVRDLISTAYVSKTTGSTFGTETTLFAGATNTFHDLIYVLASNDSTAAIGMDIRSTVGGGVMMHLEIPANGVVGIATPVPLPAGDVGASWTIDLPDVTGTNVYVSALFSKEI